MAAAELEPSNLRGRGVAFGRALAGTAAVAAFLILPSVALANTYKPTRFDDPRPNGCKKTDCSLREAVIAANAHPGAM
jgi:CSLREA domain-containing protein